MDEFEGDPHDEPSVAEDLPVLVDDPNLDDLELNLDHAGRAVWLVKVPRFLLEKWSSSQHADEDLGVVRVYDEQDADGNPKIAVILRDDPPPAEATPSEPSTPSAPSTSNLKQVPTEYRMLLQNMSSKNMFIFGDRPEVVPEKKKKKGGKGKKREDLDDLDLDDLDGLEDDDDEDDEDEEGQGRKKRRRVTQLLGAINHECQLTPSLASKDASLSYQRIMRDRQRRATEPKRTIKRLDVDAGLANRLASGGPLIGFKSRLATNFVKAKTTTAAAEGRMARMPRNELIDVLFQQFEAKPYWGIKALTEHVKQPQVYLKEVLMDIGDAVQHGPYKGLWKLKESFKEHLPGVEGGEVKKEGEGGSEGLAGGVKKEAKEEDDSDDDADMEEVR